MGFAVELYLDGAAEERIRRVWASLAGSGVNAVMSEVGARPHVSLAVFDALDVDGMCAVLREFASSLSPLSTTFAAIGAFPGHEGVVFAAPVVTPALLSVHRRFHEVIASHPCDLNEYYLPGRWIPHCTLAIDLEPGELPVAVEMARQSPLFGPFTLAEIGLIEFRPVRSLCSFAALGRA